MLYGLRRASSPSAARQQRPHCRTRALVNVNHDGTFSVVTLGLNQPTSLEIVGDAAYVVSLAGEIWKIDNVD